MASHHHPPLGEQHTLQLEGSTSFKEYSSLLRLRLQDFANRESHRHLCKFAVPSHIAYSSVGFQHSSPCLAQALVYIVKD